MPLYEYKGFDQKGFSIKGEIDGDTARTARAKLRAQGIYPTDIFERTVSTSRKKTGSILSAQVGGRVKMMDVATMTKQFATLVGAHIPIVETLSALTKQVENEKLRVVLSNVKEKVNEGSSLAKALSEHPKIFSNVYVNMVQVGEASGTLDIVMERLADFTEAQLKLKNKIVTAMIYPVMMIFAMIALFILIFTFVLPSIMSIFEGQEIALPAITRLVIGFGNTIIAYWYFILGGLVLLYLFVRSYIKTEKGKYHYHRFLLRSPYLGKLLKMIALSRFSRTLSTLLSSGVPLLTAMDIVKNIVNNVLITETLSKAREAISEGKTISKPLEESGYFPPMVVHMIAVGEKTGELEKMLSTISNTYDAEVSTQIEAVTSSITPVMTILMAVIVVFFMFSIIMPAMDLMMQLGT